MPVAVAHIRVEASHLRELGWSYRRIARRLQRRHRLGALVAFRLAHGWTQEEAARQWNERWPAAGSAKTGKTWSYWESWPAKGGRAPSAAVLSRLAELYLCRPGDLLDGPDFGELDPGVDGGVEGGQPAACRCPSGDEDGCAGLLSVAAALASPWTPDRPSAAEIEERLAGLVAGWVPAA
ncbi:helix-turn-helix transcriptional regulator [Frankia sp. AgB32]|uniref:helix-turn-helix domain-containing protein n=1 Tax=Frankia sp. AgB32 TaxID=631119 RepID=UPI0027E30878|nr:helix-turn-helix transcriptional regulator [Frankia sp. AgB32]